MFMTIFSGEYKTARCIKRFFVFSPWVLALLILPWVVWPFPTEAVNTLPSPIETTSEATPTPASPQSPPLDDELKKLDELIHTPSMPSPPPAEQLLQQTEIRAQTIYQGYAKSMGTLYNGLFRIKKRLDRENNSITLQELGAMVQDVSSQNRRLKHTFHHGEEDFYSYRLTQRAISCLEKAADYWRVSDDYREIYRGSVWAKAEDDEFLRVQLQSAINAIAELESMQKAFKAIEGNLKN